LGKRAFYNEVRRVTPIFKRYSESAFEIECNMVMKATESGDFEEN